MNAQVKKVKKFHRKQRFPLGVDLTKCNGDRKTSEYLNEIADEMLLSAIMIENKMKHDGGYDLRLARTQLMIEELGETIQGLAYCDEIATFDGLSDLAFVTIGTAVSFGLPLVEGLDEVCDSNLTKNPHEDDDKRLRDKGPDYRLPNLKKVLLPFRSLVVQAEKTSCISNEQTRIVSVCVKIKYHEEPKSQWIYLAEGGVTGYESMPVDGVSERLNDGWCACAGTKGRWDTLFIPADSMQKIQNWLEEIK